MLQPRSFLFTKSKVADAERPLSERKAKPSSKVETRQPERPSTLARDSSTIPPSTPIPMRHDVAHERRRPQGRKERSSSGRLEHRMRDIHSPDALPPSVAALLALTAIPPPKNGSLRAGSGAGQRLTVDAMKRHTGGSETVYRGPVAGSPMDFLLSPPEEEDEMVGSETGRASIMSTRTLSSESTPSLDDESIHESPSLRSVVTPGSASLRGKRQHRSQSYTSAQECSSIDHPLYTPEMDLDVLDFRVFQKQVDHEPEKLAIKTQPPRHKSAFKSNLTASLRALKSAATSFTTSPKMPLLTPDDFLTRSIISIDPKVPFTDERMPPLLEDIPTPALRRYLNPTTNAPIEAHVPLSQAQTMRTPECMASIQLQTYKVSRPSKTKATTVISRRTNPDPQENVADVTTGPLARQRDMRENSDFIRVAVMEMLMRKRGKLDDQKPGRARWALPPRKPPDKAYEIAPNGVPVRWIAVTH